ncbi:MAG: glutathione peroxidase [Gammaproteobacteria bacterium]|nr:glutathione peroxidase [Gammaproteobacteria bacterium]
MSNVFSDKSGQKVPDVTFPIINNGEWSKRTSDEIFSDKTVVVFSLPGAFTPTCSSSHLPRYNELAPVFFENGVDEIVCISVNDTFVMNAWGEDQDAENISLLPDGTGEFTDKMGLLVDKSDIGFGKRSWRYSMLVKNGVVEKMFIEPDLPGDPFEVSDADTMLNYINPNVTTKDVVVISKLDCPYCIKAKALLTEKGLSFDELVEGKDITAAGLRAVSGSETVPQIFIDGQHIGGSDKLEAAL